MQEVPACPQVLTLGHLPPRRFQEGGPVPHISKAVRWGGEVCTTAASLALLLLGNFSLC